MTNWRSTTKGRESVRRYERSPLGREAQERYQSSDSYKRIHKRSVQRARKRLVTAQMMARKKEIR